MSQPSGSSERRQCAGQAGIKMKRLYSIVLYLIPLAIMFSLSFVAGAISVIGVSEFFIVTFFFPVSEEIFKFILAKKFRMLLYRLVIAFVIFEFALVKLPIFFLNSDSSNFYMFILSLTAVIFHISTMIVYGSNVFVGKPNFSLIIMIILHSVYNMLSFGDFSDFTLTLVSFLFSFSPLVHLYISKNFLKVEGVEIAQLR